MPVKLKLAGAVIRCARAIVLAGSGTLRRTAAPFLAWLAVLTSPIAFAQATSPPVRIKVASVEALNATTPFFVALRQGFFKDAGLDVSFATIGGGAGAVMAAVRSGDVDVVLDGAGTLMIAIAKRVANGKIIGESTDNNYVILGKNGVADVTQFKGKSFAISNYNGGDHVFAQAVLLHYGINPDEVNWVVLGLPAARLAALTAGKVDGTEMTSTTMPEAGRKFVIQDEDHSPVPWVANAIFASDSFLKSNKAAAQKFMAAVGKGADWARTHFDDAVAACGDTGSTEETCKYVVGVATTTKNQFTWSSTGRVNVDGIKAMIPSIVGLDSNVKDLKLEDFVDTSIADGEKESVPTLPRSNL